MKHILVTVGLISAALLSACHSQRLNYEGRNIVVVDGALTTECKRLGVVAGKSGFGYDQAMIDARNSAGRLKGADTMIVSSDEGRAPSHRITGIAFNCAERRTQPIEAISPPKPLTSEQFDKARKCQARGGVWVNDQCVVSVE